MTAPMDRDDAPDPDSHSKRTWFWRLYVAAWAIGLLMLAY